MDLTIIDRRRVSAEEQEAAESIQMNLMHLRIAVADFRSVLDLYMHIRDLNRADQIQHKSKVGWTKIAGREGAICANGLFMAMQNINKTNAPQISKLVDIEMRKRGQADFENAFRNVMSVRITAAHPGELYGKAKELEDHRLRDAAVSDGMVLGEGSFAADMMNASDEKLTFSATFKGRLVSYELSQATADKMTEAVKTYVGAFRALF